MTVAPNPEDVAAAICRRHGDNPAALLEILHDLQAATGCVPEAALPTIAKSLNIARAEVHGVASFYHDFRTTRPPAVVVKLCRAEACQAMGGERLAGTVAAALGGADEVAVEPVYCLGLCALAPAALVNDRPAARLTAERLLELVREAQS